MNKLFIIIIVSIFLISVQKSAFTQELKKGHSHTNAKIHGGAVVMTKQYHFEVVFKVDAVRVYLYDSAQKPLPVDGVTGEVTLKFKNAEPQKLPLRVASMHEEMKGDHEKMKHDHKEKYSEDEEEHHEEGHHEEDHHEEDHHEEDHENAGHKAMMMNMNYLQTKVNLSKVDAGDMKAIFSLKGLPDKKETKTTFTETFSGIAGKEESHHSEHGEHKH